MAERERLPNKERRARARAERKRQEALARKRATRRAITSAMTTVLVLTGVVAIVLMALLGDDPALDEQVELAGAEVESARERAGCEVVAVTPAGEPAHVERGAPLPPAAVQPPTGAAHFGTTVPVVRAGARTQLDPMALGHNLEHGAVAAWYDPEKLEGGTVDMIESWSERRNNAGFAQSLSGVGIFVAPFQDPGIGSGKAVALRSWSLGVDCDTWDDTVADSFLIEAYGNRGGAPEGVAFPDGLMAYADDDAPSAWRSLPDPLETD